MQCLRDNSFENALCRNESKEYLECRMERQVHASGYLWLLPPPASLAKMLIPRGLSSACVSEL